MQRSSGGESVKAHQESFTNDEILEIIDGTCPQVSIHQQLIVADYRWVWQFEGTRSEDFFLTPIEALADFTQYLIAEQQGQEEETQ